MKKTLFFLVLAFVTITSYSQNYFEKFIEPEDGVFREADCVIETDDHGYIISCRALYKHINDMLVSMTANGEITNQLVFQIDGKKLNYCGLFKSPSQDGEYIAIAVLTSGDSSSSYIQNELVFLHFDSDLNITSQNICPISSEYVNISTQSMRDRPQFIMDSDGTFLMAAHCLKNDGCYCYLFARLTIDGEIVSMREDPSFDEPINYPIDMFLKNNGDCGLIICSNNDNGGQFFYALDSSLNCVRIARLSSLDVRVVQTNPQFPAPDTVFRYPFIANGTGVAIDDTTVLLAGGGYYHTSSGKNGGNHFIAKVNDSVNVLDSKTWDIVNSATGISSAIRLSAFVKDLSVTEDAIYYCGFNGHYEYGQIYYSQLVNPTIITVSKFDKETNLLWRRYYGSNDNSYEINMIQATEDGGCILTGVSALKSNYSYYMSYVLKLDADGYDSVDETESIAKPYLCYPNPTKDNLYIELSPDVKCQSVEIYTLDGRLVETFPETSQQTTIDISGLNAGMYIVKLRTADGKEYEERIIKK